MGCPCARARSNWRQSGHKKRLPRLLFLLLPLLLLPFLLLPVPPPPPPEGPGEDPAAAASAAPQGGTTAAWPRAAIPGLDRAAWRAWGRAPGGRAEMSAPGTPAPPGRRLATKVARAEVVAARRGGRAWGTHVASGQPQGMAESAPPRAGKVPQSPPASPRNSSPASTAGKGELDVSLAGQAMVSKPQANDH